MNKIIKAKLVIISEMLFVLLPIFIIMLYEFLETGKTNIFKDSLLTFATIILFGQTIVKFATGISKATYVKRWQVVSLIFSLLIIFGLIPSVIILMVLLSSPCPSNTVYWMQVIYLFIALCSSYVIGTVGQFLTHAQDRTNEETTNT